jgi:hypothetical protein
VIGVRSSINANVYFAEDERSRVDARTIAHDAGTIAGGPMTLDIVRGMQ